MKLLLSYASIPHTTGVFLEKALRQVVSLMTYGPTADDHVMRVWDLESLSGLRKDHDVILDEGSTAELFRGLPPGWEPDCFLFVESGILYPFSFMKNLSCLKACYLIDTHLHMESHLEMARSFDVVFLAQKSFVPAFSERLGRPVFWLPLACDPEIHRPYPVHEEWDLVFAGSIQNPLQDRARRLKRLGLRFSVRSERVFLEDMSRFLSGGRVLFNSSVRNDLNMRVFESLAIGKCLVTDRVPGLLDYFVPGEDLMVYDDRSLVETVRFLLENPGLRQKIAESGRKKVLESHTYLDRAMKLESVLSALVAQGIPPELEGVSDEAHSHV
ncbi:MAG: CgeB family protein [Leptospirales bacterium]